MLKRNIPLFLFLLFSVISRGQTEQVFLHTDKKICHPNDTVWFRAYISSTDAKASSNFYLELFNEKGELVTNKVFPVINNACVGQIKISNADGSYWLRGYTLNAENDAFQSISIIDTTNHVLVKSFLKKDDTTSNAPEAVELVKIKDSNNYKIHIKKGASAIYSLSVTNIDDPSNSALLSFLTKRQPVFDTSNLSFKATVESAEGKRINTNNVNVVVSLRQDSIITTPRLLSIDSTGYIHYDNLFFFDTAYVLYKLNMSKNQNKKNIRLVPAVAYYPKFNAPASKYYNTSFRRINNFNNIAVADPFSNKSALLKEVIVKSRWMDRHRGINKKYVITPEFYPIEHFTFDLRDSAFLSRYRTAGDFVYGELPNGWAQRSMFWPECKDGVQYYVDEQLVPGKMVASKQLQEFAYAKVFEDMHPPCPCVCFWTRKGNDLDALPGQMDKIAIKGYDKPLAWTTPDPITYLWNPYIDTTDFQFTAPATSFKVVIIGFTDAGEAFTYEQTINEQNAENKPSPENRIQVNVQNTRPPGTNAVVSVEK